MTNLHIRIVQHRKIIQEFELGGQHRAVKAKPNADFILTDKTTGMAPHKVKIVRKGDDLVVTADEGETSFTITDYYTTADVELLGVVDGGSGIAPYHLNSSTMYTAITELSEATHYLDTTQEAVRAVFGAKPSLLALVGLGIFQLAVHANDTSSKPSAVDSGVSTPAPQPTTPKPAITTSVDAPVSVSEGDTLTVKVTLSNTNGNEKLALMLVGVPSANYGDLRFTNGVLDNKDGTLTVPKGVKEFEVVLPIVADSTTEGSQTLQVTVGDKTASVVIADTSTTPVVPPTPTPPTPAAIETVTTHKPAVDEGESVIVTVTLDNANGNLSVPFVLSGIDKQRQGEPTFGQGITYNNGVLSIPKDVKEFTITLPIIANQTANSDERLLIKVGEKTAEVLVADAPVVPTPPVVPATILALEAVSSVNEGDNLVVTVTLDNTNGNSNVPFSLAGVQTEDYDKTITLSNNAITQNLDGTLNIPAGIERFTITLAVLADRLTEGDEVVTLKVGNKTVSATIKDTSLTEPTVMLSNSEVAEGYVGIPIGELSVEGGVKGEQYVYVVNDPRFEVDGRWLRLKEGVQIDYETTKTIDVEIAATSQRDDRIIVKTPLTLTVIDVEEGAIKAGSDNAEILFGSDDLEDVLIGNKGNDELKGGTGSDTYILKKGDGKDTITESDTENTLVFLGIKSTEIDIDHRHLKTTISYGNGDSVSFVPTTVKNIMFEDTTWYLGDDTVRSEKLGISYWHEALVLNSIGGGTHLDRDGDGEVFFAFPTHALTGQQPDTDFVAFTEAQKIIAQEVFRHLETFLPIKFTLLENIDEFREDVIYLQNSGALPTDEHGRLGGIGGVVSDGALVGGAIWINKEELTPANYDENHMRFLIAHELGHALGLVHPTPHGDNELSFKEGYSLNDKENVLDLTVMTDISEHDTTTLPTTYQPFDVAALQYLYGINPAVNAEEDNVYTFDKTKGVFVSDGAGEDDTIDASQETQSVYINLNAGTHSYLGQKSAYISDANQLTINHGTLIEGAKGGSGNDILVGNGEDNELSGGAGDDVLTGGLGVDFFVFDYERFVLTNDDAGGNGRDVITDFYVGNVQTNPQADFISLTDLLVGYTGDKSTLTNYLAVNYVGRDTVLSIDRDGAGATYAMTELVVLEDVVVNLETLIHNGQII